MLEEGSRIIRSPRRFDEEAFRGDLNTVRDIARILGQRAEFRILFGAFSNNLRESGYNRLVTCAGV